MKRRSNVLDYLQYIVVRLIAMIMAIFPIEVNRAFMRRMAWIWFHLPHSIPETRVPAWLARIPLIGRPMAKVSASGNKLLGKFREHRNRAEEHIRLAMPELGMDRTREIALASMEQIAMVAVEVLFTPREITQWTWAQHVRLTKLDEAIRVLLNRNHGCIMLTGHYGNWELLGYSLAILGFDMWAVMRPLDNEYINRFLLDRRERSGLRLLYKKGVTQSAEEILTAKGTLSFIADQNAGAKGLFVDFFGRKASTYKSIGLLAIQHEVPIIVGCARRISPRFEYEICVTRIIHPHEWKGREDELKWITQEYCTAMEQFVREAPEQYLWIHRRWKSRPKEELAAAMSAV